VIQFLDLQYCQAAYVSLVEWARRGATGEQGIVFKNAESAPQILRPILEVYPRTCMFLLTQFGRFPELVNRSQGEGHLSCSKKITEQPSDLPNLMVKVAR
jgi:hypothetical protein